MTEVYSDHRLGQWRRVYVAYELRGEAMQGKKQPNARQYEREEINAAEQGATSQIHDQEAVPIDPAHSLQGVAIAELVASLANELSQPLAAIHSNSQAAQRFLNRQDPDLNEVREALGDILADSNRACQVISWMRGHLAHQDHANRCGIENLRKTDKIDRGIIICRRIVESLGGRFWVDVEPDRGTVYHFTLPSESRRQHERD